MQLQVDTPIAINLVLRVSVRHPFVYHATEGCGEASETSRSGTMLGWGGIRFYKPSEINFGFPVNSKWAIALCITSAYLIRCSSYGYTYLQITNRSPRRESNWQPSDLKTQKSDALTNWATRAGKAVFQGANTSSNSSSEPEIQYLSLRRCHIL